MSAPEEISSAGVEEACYERDFEKLRRWGATVELVGLFPGETPLHHWAGSGDEAVVAVLLECGFAAVVNRFDDIGYTALHRAAMSGHIGVVRRLVSASARVDARDESRVGETALDFAVQRGHVEIVHALLDEGADPTIRTWMGLNACDRIEERIKARLAELARWAERVGIDPSTFEEKPAKPIRQEEPDTTALLFDSETMASMTAPEPAQQVPTKTDDILNSLRFLRDRMRTPVEIDELP